MFLADIKARRRDTVKTTVIRDTSTVRGRHPKN